jgi:hypothetical protein
MFFKKSFVAYKDLYAARHEPEALHSIARSYWSSVVVGLFVVLTGAIGYGIWEFFRTPQPDDATSGVRPQLAFTRAQLQDLLGQFDARRVRFEERMNLQSAIKDPS